MNKTRIFFDSTNPSLLRSLMEEYGDSKYPFDGENEDGEKTEIHISKEEIIYKTMQKNGWVRVNYFDENGIEAGETFDGRWKQ